MRAFWTALSCLLDFVKQTVSSSLGFMFQRTRRFIYPIIFIFTVIFRYRGLKKKRKGYGGLHVLDLS